MKLLSFLGIGKYESTCYTWQGMECTSRFATVASYCFLKPQSVILFLTEEAHQSYFEPIRHELPAEVDLHPQTVPHGQNENELWQIFSIVSDACSPGEEVAFDITNGFRSFPLLGLLAAAFLQAGLNVRLKAVFYGAYDVRDLSVTPSRTPMFDLSPMISLLAWSAAADRFKQSGDARLLADLIKGQRKELYLQGTDRRSGAGLSSALGNLAGALDQVSQALRLIRPFDAMEHISRLPGAIEKARPALEQSGGTRPFSLLLEQVNQAYLPLGLAEPRAEENQRSSLDKQRQIIAWYIEHEYWVQAITLMREWLVSWFMFRRGLPDMTSKKDREEVEKIINSESHAMISAEKIKLTNPPATLQGIDKELLGLWSDLAQARNDIDHAGMRPNPRAADKLVKKIRRFHEHLRQIPL